MQGDRGMPADKLCIAPTSSCTSATLADLEFAGHAGNSL